MAELAADEQVTIAAPAAAVWAYRLDFTNLPEYNPDVSGVVRVADGSGPGGVTATGARYEFDLSTAQGPHRVTLVVTEAREDVEVSAQMAGAMTANETFLVERLDARTSRAVLRLWLDLPAGLPEEHARAILQNGRAQIRSELDGMQKALELRHQV